MSPRQAASQRTEPASLPGVGAFAGMAFAVVLVPALLVAGILRVAGASLAVACMVGLAIVFVGMAAYPRVLRLLKWLPAKPRRTGRS